MDGSDSVKADGKTASASAIRSHWIKVVEEVLAENRRSWSDFTKGTTLHGLKYVFEPTFRIRRVVWLLAVLASMIMFALQVLMRGSDYFRYETNVDVQVVYRSKVVFPAVTLCNQNNFRLTALAELNLYKFIDDVYSADNASEIDFSKYHLNQLDTEVFLRQVAHQKHDLIESCYWKGKPCDIETDFQEQLTGLGVCYTFNAATNGSVLVADEPGSRSGLSLILNLEQYEYTKGPQGDAGVKILLHGQSEYPLMEDMGFAAAPGTHTLVGVNAAKVKNLPPPHGTCNNEGVPMSDCMRDCRTKQVIDRCSCKAPHMRDLADISSMDCSIQKFFTCIHTIEEDQVPENKTDNFCDCTLPCERTQYESSISYAQLSRFNVERVVLSDPRKRELMRQKQVLARETFQRVDKTAMARDEAEYGDLMIYSNDLLMLAGNTSRVFSHEMHFQLMENISDALFSDLITVDEEYKRRWSLINGLWTSIYKDDGPIVRPENFVYDLFWFIDKGNWTENLVSCLDVYNRTGNTTWCDKLVFDSHGTFELIQQKSETLRGDYKAAYTFYANTVGDFYADSPVNQNNLTEHQLCLSTYEDAISGTGNDLLNETETALQRLATITTIVDYVEEVQNLLGLVYSEQFKEAMISFQEVGKRCSWFTRFGDQWGEAYKAAYYPLEYESNSINFLVTTAQKRVLPSLSTVKKLIGDNVFAILERTLRYMDGALSKLGLYHELQYATFRATPDDLDVSITELSSNIKAIVLELDLIETEIRRGFKELFELQLPVVSNGLFDELQFLTMARSLGIPELNHLIDSLYTQENKTQTMIAIVGSIFNALRQPVLDLQERILDTATNLVSTMNQQQSGLHTFAEEVATNDAFYMSNFMKVDIYYKELKFDKIEQFPAFQSLSLLGEIGGFLGLLLGASVLTLFELLDFITLTIVNKLCKKAAGNTPKKEERF